MWPRAGTLTASCHVFMDFERLCAGESLKFRETKKMERKKRSRREKDRDMSSKQEYMLSQEVFSKYNLNEMKYERQTGGRILWQVVKEGP